MMRAVIYTRYSGQNEREASLEDQERLCRQEADRLGYAVTNVYKDAARSGQLSEEQRPGFAAMQEAARRHEFDVLIVDDASRLSRDQADALRVLKRFEFWGVGLIARTDGVNTLQNPRSSRLLFGVKSAFSEEFLRDLGEKTHRGLEGRVRNGMSPGGLPYGYRSEPVLDDRGRVTGFRRVIHEPEAEVVRRIFRLYTGDEGGHPHSAREIVLVLNRDGIAPPGARWRGRTKRQCATWTYTAIIGHRRLAKGILNNPLYDSRLVWNRSRWLRDPDTKRYTYRVRPQDDWIIHDVPELRVVPQNLWNKAQARMTSRRVTAPVSPVSPRFRKYLLSGFLKCATCGANYIITTPYSYRCGASHDRGPVACTNHRPASRARLERTVLDALRDRLYTEDRVRAITDRVREALLVRARRENAETSREDHAKALRRVERVVRVLDVRRIELIDADADRALGARQRVADGEVDTV